MVTIYKSGEQFERKKGYLYLECLGSGTGLNPELGNTSFIVSTPESEARLLLDCGFTVTPKLVTQGRLKEITDILISHPHSDHIGGLELMGFMSYFVFKAQNPNYKLPRLHLASDKFNENLWKHCLKGTMEKIQDLENVARDSTLDMFFDVKTEQEVKIDGLPKITFKPTIHVQNMEAYSFVFDNGIYYSADTVEVPPDGHELIMQDVGFAKYKSQVHISLEELEKELNESVKKKTYLMHLGGGREKHDIKAKGFADFILPGDVIEMPL